MAYRGRGAVTARPAAAHPTIAHGTAEAMISSPMTDWEAINATAATAAASRPPTRAASHVASPTATA